MPAQLGLKLQGAPDYARAAFVVSTSNAAAAHALDAWPDWRGGALALVGPAGCGKTHLAIIWARRLGAALGLPAGVAEGGPAEAAEAAGRSGAPVLVEDVEERLAEGAAAEEALFHLLNLAAAPGRGLLITARRPPSRWPARLPDLRSRLNALPVAELGEPDDAVLTAMLEKFFRERSIRPSEELLAYLVRRIERSGQAAHQVVARLDEAAHAMHRSVSRSLARAVLEAAPAGV